MNYYTVVVVVLFCCCFVVAIGSSSVNGSVVTIVTSLLEKHKVLQGNRRQRYDDIWWGLGVIYMNDVHMESDGSTKEMQEVERYEGGDILQRKSCQKHNELHSLFAVQSPWKPRLLNYANITLHLSCTQNKRVIWWNAEIADLKVLLSRSNCNYTTTNFLKQGSNKNKTYD